MNIITFDYTKADGKVSKRVLSPIIIPNKMYEGVDLTELDESEQAEYVVAIEKARSLFAEECACIQAKFDLKNRYRRFDPTKMTNVVQESI